MWQADCKKESKEKLSRGMIEQTNLQGAIKTEVNTLSETLLLIDDFIAAEAKLG